MSTAVIARPQFVLPADLPEAETRLYDITVPASVMKRPEEELPRVISFSSDAGRWTYTSEEHEDGTFALKVRWTEEGEVTIGLDAEEVPTLEKRKREYDPADAEDEQEKPGEPLEEEEEEEEDEEASPPSPKKARSDDEDFNSDDE